MSQNNKMVFLSLPVTNLPKSIGFYEALGFKQNMQFSDDTAACMNLTETFSVMLLTYEKWMTFTKKSIPDTKKNALFSVALAADSRSEVDRMVEAGAKAGGKMDANPPQDHGFMYQRTIEDPDGYNWEPTWMDMSALPQQ